MAARRRIYRLTIGMFDEPDEVCTTMHDLGVAGFTPNQLCLIGTLDAMDGAARATGNESDDARQIIPLFLDIEPLGTTRHGEELYTSTGSLPRALIKAVILGGQCFPNTRAQTTQGLPESLQRGLNSGVAVIVISAGSPEQLLTATRIMLKRSQYSVQTLEFYWP